MIAIVSGVETRVVRGVDESPVAVIAKEHARRSVACVVVRCRRARLVFAGAEEIGVDAQIQIDKTVPVVVRHRDRRQHALKRPRESEGVRNGREMSFAVVDEQQRVGRRRHHQILIAVVVDVDKERLRRVIEDADARCVGDVLERRVAAIAVEAIGQSGRLSDVQIVESISVRIADRDALMAVRVARQDRVERGHPRVEIDVELAPERVVATERRRRDLREDWLSRAADQMRPGRPTNNLPAGRVSSPSHLPLADLLDAVGLRSCADDVVADGGAEA